jgi:preprotein translocase subunit SecD
MNKNLGWKLILSIVVILVFVYGIFGVPSGFSGSALAEGLFKESPLRHGISLGLDLRGGTHLILQVQVNDAINSTSDRAVDLLKDEMSRRKINYTDISKPDPTNNPDQIVVKGVTAADQRSDLEGIINDRLPEYDHRAGAENSITLNMKVSNLNDLKNRAVEQAIETIRSRIDALGVSEPIIQQHGLGQYQILVQLPGVDDPTRVKEIIKSTAMLEIKQVLGGPYASEAEALQQNGNMYPPNSILMKYRGLGNSVDEDNRWYLVTRTSAVAGADLRPNGASVNRDSNTNQPEVSFSLTNEGGRKFGDFTRRHIKESLAVVLDNRVREVATINDEIHDQGRISGGGMKEENARDLALVLNSGALPAGLSYLEERTVGPSLGKDSIHAGVTAAIIGMIAVLIFMLIYYRGAGVNADLALILNLIILLGFLGFSGATLTLPGIAGVILTVGMGVDSNVLIFERIREELRNGKTPPSAVDQGFSHAWITIVDTHVTTVVSALILFLFGTGPVKGFAVTLTFGLLANLFTAVFVSRMIFDWELGRHQRGEALSI